MTERQDDERAAAYMTRLSAVALDIPATMLLDINGRLGDWALSGRPMDAPYVLHLVENAELMAKHKSEGDVTGDQESD